MRLKSASGLTLVELVVVVAVLLTLLSALFGGSLSNDPLLENMTVVGARGKDIFVALAAANAERQALGLPSLWPRDYGAGGGTNETALALPAFTNSTAYFAWLLGAQDDALPGWTPQARGINYGKLVGAGVRMCPVTNRFLTAENNMWTVAKNVRDDMNDFLPLLVSRNIDASSLAARATEGDLQEKSLRFDSAWKTPFGRKGYVLIRKSGAVFKARPKYMNWGVVYQSQAFDTSRTPDGRAAPPLKYLTPSGEVVLSP